MDKRPHTWLDFVLGRTRYRWPHSIPRPNLILGPNLVLGPNLILGPRLIRGADLIPGPAAFLFIGTFVWSAGALCTTL